MNNSSTTNNENIIVEKGISFERVIYNDVQMIRHDKSGYYNVSRICTDNGKRYHDILRNQGYIRYMMKVKDEAEKSDHSIFESYRKYGASFELSNFGNNVKGVYAHPLLMDYVCSWTIPEYDIRSRIVAYTEAMKRMNTENEKNLEEVINAINEKTRYEEMKNANENNRFVSKAIVLNLDEGASESIKTDICDNSKNTFHLIASKRKQTINGKTTGLIYLNDAINVLRLLDFYVKYNCIPGLKFINTNTYEAESYKVIHKYILDVANRNIDIKIDYDYLILRNLQIKGFSSIPFLFEIYCSMQFEIAPFKFSMTESIGLGKNDIGCDLLDIKHEITGQCKYYKSSMLELSHLSAYFEFVRFMKYKENYIFLNKGALIDPKIQIYDENMNILNNKTFERIAECEYYTIIPDFDEPITLIFVDDDEFEKFVNEMEGKFAIDKEVAEYTENLKREMEVKIQKFKNEKAAKISKMVEIKAIEDHKKTIHEAKDDKFEGTSIEEQRKFLKELIKKNPSGIPFEECLKIMNETFNANYNNIDFGHKFSDLYAHRSNSTYPTINGQRYILPVGSLEDEIDFIKNYIDIKDVPVDDYLEIHNKEFGQHYSAASFGYKFGKMFKNDGTCFARKTIDGARIHVLQLIDANRNERIIEIVNDLLNEFGELPVPLIVFYLRFKCRILYSSSGFMVEFKNFKYTCARFNNKRREAFNKLVNTFDENLKKIFDEQYKSTISPNFIIG